MSMAELPFTDFLESAVAPARRARRDTDSRFGQVQAPLTQSAHSVEDPAKNHDDHKEHAEQHLGCQHLLHEVELEYETAFF
jgi:hypothetical protein